MDQQDIKSMIANNIFYIDEIEAACFEFCKNNIKKCEEENRVFEADLYSYLLFCLNERAAVKRND